MYCDLPFVYILYINMVAVRPEIILQFHEIVWLFATDMPDNEWCTAIRDAQ